VSTEPSITRDRVFRFGHFELSEREGELRKGGVRIKLQEQPFRVLVELVANSGNLVSREDLHKQLWSADTFVDFDVGLNSAIRKLRQALNDDAENPRYIETLAKRGYRFVAPVADGATRALESSTRDSKANTPPDTGPYPTPATVEFTDSIAVLPFENEGRNPEIEYLSDGIAETIINNLAQMERLRVIPRTTAFRYKGKLLDPAQVGRELRARVVLTGRVVQRGERLIVGAELIDTVHESQLWGRTIDRGIEDILSIQNEIAAEISNSLHLRLTDAEKKRLTRRPTESRDAYHLYLKAMYFANQWTAEGVRKGFEYCRQAIEADPIYAEAYTGLAYLYVLAGVFGGAPPVEAFAKAKASAVKALEIDDGIANAHAILGFVRLVYEWDWEGSRAELRRATELAPNLAAGHYAYSHWYLSKQLYEEALSEANVALDIDPLSVTFNYQVGAVRYYARQYSQAIEQLQKATELNPLFVPAYEVLAFAYARDGMSRAATAQAEKALQLLGGDLRGKAIWAGVSALIGNQDEARKVLHEIEKESRPPYSPDAVQCAWIHKMLGQRNEALDWLEKALQGRTGSLIYLAAQPEFQDLHGDPRFDALLRRIGLTA